MFDRCKFDIFFIFSVAHTSVDIFRVDRSQIVVSCRMASNDERDPSSIVPRIGTDATRSCCIVVDACHVIMCPLVALVAQSRDSHRRNSNSDRINQAITWKNVEKFDSLHFFPHSTCAHLHTNFAMPVGGTRRQRFVLSVFVFAARANVPT